MPLAWFEDEEHSPDRLPSDVTLSCKSLFKFIKLFIPHILIITVNILFSLIGAIVFEWRTGLTSIGLIPLILLSQFIQFGFVQGLSASKGKIYSSSAETVKESIMNIRTVLSLGGPQMMQQKY